MTRGTICSVVFLLSLVTSGSCRQQTVDLTWGTSWPLSPTPMPKIACGKFCWTMTYAALMNPYLPVVRKMHLSAHKGRVLSADDSVWPMPWLRQLPSLPRVLLGKIRKHPVTNPEVYVFSMAVIISLVPPLRLLDYLGAQLSSRPQ